MALTSFPALNASLSEDESSVFLHPDHNIGVAMDTERGLLVPCISAVQEKSILEIAEVFTVHRQTAAKVVFSDTGPKVIVCVEFLQGKKSSSMFEYYFLLPGPEPLCVFYASILR